MCLTSEAPPQTDELMEGIFPGLKRSDAGCWMLDKEKKEFIISSSI
jgi:hypothetical protein